MIESLLPYLTTSYPAPTAFLMPLMSTDFAHTPCSLFMAKFEYALVGGLPRALSEARAGMASGRPLASLPMHAAYCPPTARSPPYAPAGPPRPRMRDAPPP